MQVDEKQNQDLIKSFKEENTLLNLANVSSEELEQEVKILQGNLEQVMLQKFLKQKPQEGKRTTKDLLNAFYQQCRLMECNILKRDNQLRMEQHQAQRTEQFVEKSIKKDDSSPNNNRKRQEEEKKLESEGTLEHDCSEEHQDCEHQNFPMFENEGSDHLFNPEERLDFQTTTFEPAHEPSVIKRVIDFFKDEMDFCDPSKTTSSRSSSRRSSQRRPSRCS